MKARHGTHSNENATSCAQSAARALLLVRLMIQPAGRHMVSPGFSPDSERSEDEARPCLQSSASKLHNFSPRQCSGRTHPSPQGGI